METISEKIRSAGNSLLQALHNPSSNIYERINATLNEFLSWPFQVDSACIIDNEGHKANFGTVVYSGSGKQIAPASTVNADATACVIHAVRSLDAGEIHIGYESIAAVKRVKRTRAPEAGSETGTNRPCILN